MLSCPNRPAILSSWGSPGSDVIIHTSIGPQCQCWGGVHPVTRSASSKSLHLKRLPGQVLRPTYWGSWLSIWTSGRFSVRPRQPPFSRIGPTTVPSTSSPVLSVPEKEAMNTYINEGLTAGIIRPSSSPAGAGFFFVEKKDKTLRPCIDYR